MASCLVDEVEVGEKEGVQERGGRAGRADEQARERGRGTLEGGEREDPLWERAH